MIPDDRLREIADLPRQRDSTEASDQEANYRVGKLMADAIRELVQDRLGMVLQLRKMTEDRDAWIKKETATSGRLVEALLQESALLGQIRDMGRDYQAIRELDRLLRVAEDALGPDRTPTDRKAALMKIGKALVERPTQELQKPCRCCESTGCQSPSCRCADKRVASPPKYERGDDVSDDAMRG